MRDDLVPANPAGEAEGQGDAAPAEGGEQVAPEGDANPETEAVPEAEDEGAEDEQ